MTEKNIESKWMHIWIKNNKYSKPYEAKKIIDSLNKNIKNKSKHVLINSFICSKVVLRALSDLLTLTLKLYKIISTINQRDKQKYDLWSTHRNDFYSSIFGSLGAYNILMFHLFDRAFQKEKKRSNCIFLQENQSWEVCLIGAQKKSESDGCVIIGAPHTTIRFWDLRFSRLWNDFPKTLQPDLVLSNGPIPKSKLIEHKVPFNIIWDVEALRYEALGKHINKFTSNKIDSGAINILAIGEYDKSGTMYQLKMLHNALLELNNLNSSFIVTFKPHPSCNIDVSIFSDIDIRVSEKTLFELMYDNDLVVSGGQTTAAVDLYCFGIPIITCMNAMSLNLNPLDGLPGSFSVNSSNELKNIINNICNQTKNYEISRNYFTINEKLPYWHSLLKNISRG